MPIERRRMGQIFFPTKSFYHVNWLIAYQHRIASLLSSPLPPLRAHTTWWDSVHEKEKFEARKRRNENPSQISQRHRRKSPFERIFIFFFFLLCQSFSVMCFSFQSFSLSSTQGKLSTHQILQRRLVRRQQKKNFESMHVNFKQKKFCVLKYYALYSRNFLFPLLCLKIPPLSVFSPLSPPTKHNDTR